MLHRSIKKCNKEMQLLLLHCIGGESLVSTRSVVVTELKSVIVFMFPLLCLFIMLFPVVVMEVVILCIWGGNFPYVYVYVSGGLKGAVFNIS